MATCEKAALIDALLPVELISHVFSLIARSSTVGGDTLPTAISLVSRRWREIALQTHALWSVITLSDGPPFTRTQLWLERSRNVPIYIALKRLPWMKKTFPVTFTLHDSEKEAIQNGISLLIPHMHRWEGLVVDVFQKHGIAELFLQIIQAEGGKRYAPRLETLQLVDSPGPSTPAVSLSTPELRDFSLKGIDPDCSQLSLGLQSITDFNLHCHRSLGSHQLLEVLEQMPQLLRCQLEGRITVNHTPRPVDKPVELGCLKLLTVELDDCTFQWSLLKALNAPKLVDLRLGMHGTCLGMEAVHSALSGRSQSFPNLQRIYWITFHSGTIPCMQKLIDLAPNVVSVNIGPVGAPLKAELIKRLKPQNPITLNAAVEATLGCDEDSVEIMSLKLTWRSVYWDGDWSTLNAGLFEKYNLRAS
ncbi:hypothetical protein FRC03_007529 [Tulasnella sp. 419]|nr:hypothetical protein FRC03_007529 [Tulasnella sp. 419]